MIEYVGKDPNGIPRVWGRAPEYQVAETQCRVAAEEYVARRPDTGPLSQWTFTRN